MKNTTLVIIVIIVIINYLYMSILVIPILSEITKLKFKIVTFSNFL